ncbi:MAG TPA: hypothetical protein VJ901_01985 [Thermoanaerobaculia bacterium]|nr:hypothetical protein [Thermoanaerobaculia bacterium]
MSRLRVIVAAAIAAFFLLTLLDRFKVIEILAIRVAIPFFLACVEGIAIIGTGFAVRGLRGRVWRVHRESGLDLPLDYVIGLPIFGTLCFLLATIGVAKATMLPLLVLAILFGAYASARWRESGGVGVGQALSLSGQPERLPYTGQPERSPYTGQPERLPYTRQPERSPYTRQPERLPYTVIFIVFACAFIAAQAPPTSLDELAYHLAIPKTWLLEGRAIALPLLSHSYFPLGVESASLPLLTLIGDEGGVASHFIHLFAAIATAMLIHRRTKNALITAAIVTTPALAITAGWSLVDFPLLGICVALWLAVENDDDATIAAAIGAGLLTKYTFIPFAFIAAKRWRAAIPGVLIGSVFFIRNLIVAGNPIAPFLSASAPHLMHYRAYLSDYVFDPQFIDESLGAAMLMLAPLVTGIIPIALLALGIVFFFLGPSSRLLIPFFAIPAMSANVDRRWFRWLLALAVAVQTLMVVYLTDRNAAFELLASNVEGSYLAQQRPSIPAISWLNRTLPDNSRTLVIGTGESFWFSHRVRAGGNFDSDRMSAYLATPTPEALREELRRDGITHVAIVAVTAPPTQVVQKIEERQTRLTPAAQRMLSQFLDRYVESVASGNGATLFTIKQ